MKNNILGTSILIFLTRISLLAGADAGIEQEVRSGVEVKLVGSESTLDKDGEFISFRWEQTGGLPIVHLSNHEALSPTFIAPDIIEATVLTFSLSTEEQYKCNKRKCRILSSRDFLDIIILQKEVIPEEVIPVEVNFDPLRHEGFTYIPVISPRTGRAWLDRNLGATKPCTSGTVQECIGSRYQWGRESDGHQFLDTRIKLVGRTDTLFGNGNIFFDNFDGDWTTATVDVSGDIRNDFWSQTDGNSICPIGYRVPKIEELNNEVINSAIDSSLGFLNIRISAPSTTYWSVTNQIFRSIPFRIDGREVADDFDRINGFSVRCIKD